MTGERPLPSSVQVSRRMSVQARRDTEPELRLRRLLHAAGRRYRVAWPIPGLSRRTIDIAFLGQRVAVNVHGCFWHGCEQHGTSPAANRAWWAAKIDRNRERDAQTREHLRRLGWTVIEVWEHEDPAAACTHIIEVLDAAPPRQVGKRSSAGFPSDAR